MSGDRIHVFEKDSIPGGACDGYEYPGLGYVMQGDREMDNHVESDVGSFPVDSVHLNRWRKCIG